MVLPEWLRKFAIIVDSPEWIKVAREILFQVLLDLPKFERGIIPYVAGGYSDEMLKTSNSFLIRRFENYRNMIRQIMIAAMRLTMSATSPEITAWRAFLIPTAPKYTAKT